MAPFRRPGLEDDESESRPDTLRPRPPPSFRGLPVYASSKHQNNPSNPFIEDEDSVSGLSAMSDLESLYLESSSNNRPKDARDQYLLAQRLPGQPTNDISYGKEHGPTDLLNGFLDENDDEEDNWEDTVYAATLQHSRQPQTAPKQHLTVDPAEQERLDLNKAIAESRLQHEKEQMLLAQIIEDDEESQDEKNNSIFFPSKRSKKRDKKSDNGKPSTKSQDAAEKSNKKKGIWSALNRSKKRP